MIALAVLPIIETYLFGQVVNKVIEYLQDKDVSTEDIFYLLAGAILAHLITSFIYKIIELLEQLNYIFWNKEASILVFDKVSKLSFTQFEDPKIQATINKLKEDWKTKPSNFISALMWSFKNLITLVSTTMLLISTVPIFIPIVFISTIPEFLIHLKFSYIGWGIWDAKASVYLQFNEIENKVTTQDNLKEIKLFGIRKYLVEKAQKLYSEFLNEGKKYLLSATKSAFFARALQVAVKAGIEITLLARTISRAISVGNYVFYRGIVGEFSEASSNIFRNLSKLYESNLYMDDLYEFLKLETTDTDSTTKGTKLAEDKVPSIEFRNVTFTYPKGDRPVFKNFSIKIPSGEDIAIVGKNGAGKTTFVKLLAGFYNIQSGQILIDGKDISEINLASWYKKIGILFQDFNKYNAFSASDNIGLGNIANAGDTALVERAAIKAGADEFIRKFKYGYDQILSSIYEKGIEPSGGQWQRIALARAFFRNSDILILDEPTSAVDALAEYEIFKKISEVQEKKTTIIISHRFSTVRHADRIFVLDEGEIVENGSHDELMRHEDGLYRQMFSTQAEGYK